MNIDSFESERLRKLIADKKSYLAKQTNPTAAKHLQREIMFLENEILPVVLINSTILHGEVLKYCIRCFDESIRLKCNGLLIYLPVWTDYKERPVIGIANCKKSAIDRMFGEGVVDVFCSQVEIHNLDGSGVDNVKCFTLDIDGYDS